MVPQVLDMTKTLREKHNVASPEGKFLVTNFEIEKSHHSGDGYSIVDYQFEIDKITDSEKLRYSGQFFNPKESDPTTPPVVYTTPWLTELKGFNTLIGKQLAKNGLPAISLGPEHPQIGESIRHLTRTILNKEKILERDANSYNALLDYLNKEKIQDTSRITLFGYSRGSMIGIALNSLSKFSQRQILYNEFIDLCLLDSVQTMHLSLGKVAINLVNELIDGLIEVRKLPFEEQKHLLNTIPLDLSALIEQTSTGIALFRGETGLFLDKIPRDITGTVTFFNNSIFNQMDKWIQELNNFPNIHILNQKGYHLSGLNPQIILEGIGRIILFQKQYQNGIEPSEAIQKL